MMRSILTCFFLLLGSPVQCFGLVVQSGLTSEMRSLGLFMHDYKDIHGEFPKSWTEVDEVSEHVDWDREPYRLRQRIVFIDENVTWDNRSNGGRVVAMNRDPFRPESFSRSRWSGQINSKLLDLSYTIFTDHGGNLHFQEVSPQEAEAMFSEAGAKFPKSSGLGPYPHEIKARNANILRWLVGIAILFFGTTVIIRMVNKPRPKK